MGFTRSKFLGFSKKKQQKELLKLIRAIEEQWHEEISRLELLNEFEKCLKFYGYDTEELTNFSLREFLLLAVPLEREFGKDLQDQDMVIHQRDREDTKTQKVPVTLILDNLRSSFNVGSIFRSAECFGITKIYLCGYTPTPKNRKVKKTAMGTEKKVDWETAGSSLDVISKLKDLGIKIYGLETVENVKSLSEAEFSDEIAFIFGNEALGLPKEKLRQIDEILRIPMHGWKNSLNVGVTAAICCYEASRQLGS